MNRQEAEKYYIDQGLETEYGFDKAGKLYEPHRHERTWLYTLSGGLTIRLDEGEWQELKRGQELVIGDNQLHEAKTGPEGWEYVAAWEQVQ